MRYLTLLFVLLFSFALITCDEETPEPTACEQFEDLQDQAADVVCTADATCVYCDCHAQGLVLSVTVDGSDLNFDCVEDTSTCDSSSAEGCLADETVCLADLTDAAQSACASSIPLD